VLGFAGYRRTRQKLVLYTCKCSAGSNERPELAGEGEKEKEEFIYVSSRLLNTRESDDVNIWWCCLVVHVHSGTEEQCGRRRPAVVGVLTIEEQEPDEVTGESVASDRGE
jgi:hypothetical protein